MAAVQRKLVHKQFNSPMGLYSQQNVKETLDRELKAFGTDGIEIDEQITKPLNLTNSEVLRAVEEEEVIKCGYKRVAWPPKSEERIVREYTPQPQSQTPQGEYNNQPTQQQQHQPGAAAPPQGPIYNNIQRTARQNSPYPNQYLQQQQQQSSQPQQQYQPAPQQPQQQQPVQYIQAQYNRQPSHEPLVQTNGGVPHQQQQQQQQQYQPHYQQQSSIQEPTSPSGGWKHIHPPTVKPHNQYRSSVGADCNYSAPHQQQQAPQHQPQQQKQYRAPSYEQYPHQQTPQYNQQSHQQPHQQPQQQQYQAPPSANQYQPQQQQQPSWAYNQPQQQQQPSWALNQPQQHQQQPQYQPQPHNQQQYQAPPPSNQYQSQPPQQQYQTEPQSNQYNSYSQPQQYQQQQQQHQPISQDQPDYQRQHQQQQLPQDYRGGSPGIITLRKETPVTQKAAPVYNSQPAAISFQGGSNMRGDLKWPPPEYKVAAAQENEERRKLALGPACRPRRVNRDYTTFFAKNALNSYYPPYKVPPGTQHMLS